MRRLEITIMYLLLCLFKTNMFSFCITTGSMINLFVTCALDSYQYLMQQKLNDSLSVPKLLGSFAMAKVLLHAALQSTANSRCKSHSWTFVYAIKYQSTSSSIGRSANTITQHSVHTLL